MKIYIIGQVGSGKTTLAKKLAQKYNIKYYELDKVIWDDENGNIKRSKDEQLKLFNEIINQDSWIIEDVGREMFKDSYEKCDKIYYLKHSKITLYQRIIKRWIKQLLKIEKSNYKPTIISLIEMISWLAQGLKKEEEKINTLKKYESFTLLTKKDINSIN